MKKILIFMFTVSILQAQVHVNGYYKKDGTYVQPYYRTTPDGFLFNNYSYTHKLGQCIFSPTDVNNSIVNMSPNQNVANATATRDLQCMQMHQIAIDIKMKEDNIALAKQIFQTQGMNENSINMYGIITGDITTSQQMLAYYQEQQKLEIEKDKSYLITSFEDFSTETLSAFAKIISEAKDDNEIKIILDTIEEISKDTLEKQHFKAPTSIPSAFK